MDIIDELSDRDKRKKNMIVYNLPESKSDSDAFADLYSSVYSCTVASSVGNTLKLAIPFKIILRIHLVMWCSEGAVALANHLQLPEL